MKICFIITGLSVGGAEMMLFKLLQHSSSLRQGVVVSLASGGKMAYQIRALGVRVEELGMQRSLFNVSALIRLKNLLSIECFDIISTWMYHADFLGGILAKMTSIPVLWNIRNSNVDVDKTKWTTRTLVWISGKLSGVIPQRIIACSSVACSIHISIGYKKEKFIIIPNGFDLDKFYPDYNARISVCSELGIQDNSFLVGLVARFDPQKNHIGFLEAAHEIIKKKQNIQFILVGSGVDWNNELLSKKIDNLGLRQNIYLLGLRTDISRLMAAFDVLVSSSHGEAFPNVLGEAMACGTPCVATNAGDSAYILGKCGKIVPIGDMQALARGVVELLSLPAKKREALGCQARSRVRELFEIGHIARMYENIFEEVRRTCVV